MESINIPLASQQSKKTTISNNGITYIIDNTNPERLVVITVYLTEEEMSEHEAISYSNTSNFIK